MGDHWEQLLDLSVDEAGCWDQGGTEPLLTCTECAWTALLGDWKISSCMAVAHLAVIIDHTWSNLADPLMEALRTDLGGRWAYVHRHL